MTRFLQIHTLTSYPAALLNRDDQGFAKRVPFGGVTRTRISSQCLKRHWRTHEGKHALEELDVPKTVRSRLTFQRLVREALTCEDQERAKEATEIVMKEVLGESNKAKAKKKKAEDDGEVEDLIKTGQVTVLGEPEIAYLRTLAQKIVDLEVETKGLAKAAKKSVLTKDEKANLAALKHAAGLSAALFGRMVTSDNLARGDAAIHVAHALTVHAQANEADYFSAIDDLSGSGGDDELGSGHIGHTELTSGLFYSYVVVDVELLRKNLGDPTSEETKNLAGDIVSSLVNLIATVSPGAKLGSTAPYARAHCLMVESGDTQPRTLANAFLKPVEARGDLLASTYRALASFHGDERRMHGDDTERALAAMGSEADALADSLQVSNQSVRELADWARDKVRGA